MRAVTHTIFFQSRGSVVYFLTVLRIPMRDPGAFLTTGSGIGKNSGSGSRMNNPDYISESLNNFVLKKYLNSLMRIRDEKIRIRDKHPGSATL
jgi:hypothetical protein